MRRYSNDENKEDNEEPNQSSNINPYQASSPQFNNNTKTSENQEYPPEHEEEKIENSSPEKPKNELYVKNLNYKTTQEGFQNFFEKYGKVLKANILTKNGLSRGAGFVAFEEREVAEKVLGMNDLELDGWKLIVKWANNKTTIHVGNINYKTTEEDLKNFFSDCGDIKSISIAKNREGKSYGFAYIDFENESGVEKSLKKNGEMLNDRQIKVAKNLSRNERNNMRNNYRGSGRYYPREHRSGGGTNGGSFRRPGGRFNGGDRGGRYNFRHDVDSSRERFRDNYDREKHDYNRDRHYDERERRYEHDRHRSRDYERSHHSRRHYDRERERERDRDRERRERSDRERERDRERRERSDRERDRERERRERSDREHDKNRD